MKLLISADYRMPGATAISMLSYLQEIVKRRESYFFSLPGTEGPQPDKKSRKTQNFAIDGIADAFLPKTQKEAGIRLFPNPCSNYGLSEIKQNQTILAISRFFLRLVPLQQERQPSQRPAVGVQP